VRRPIAGAEPWESAESMMKSETGASYSSKWVRIEGGLPPFRLKKRDPPTLSSKALLSKKNQQKCPKRAKIAKKRPKEGKKSQK
jgi:hypothetical protein